VLRGLHPSINLVQRRALVRSDVLGLVAPDLVLRFILAGVVHVSFVIEIFCVNPHDPAAHMTRLRTPANVIADSESVAHHASPAMEVLLYTLGSPLSLSKRELEEYGAVKAPCRSRRELTFLGFRSQRAWALRVGIKAVPFH
jgi:hypothetical protein